MKKDLLTQVQEASFALKSHQVISFPTETVMGLGIIFDDVIAFNKLNKVKNRPNDKPYTMMLGYPQDIDNYAYVNDIAKKIINAFLPGSITLLLKKKDSVPNYITHGSDIVGVRVPSNIEALSLLRYIKTPLLVPSANKSGEKPAMNDKEVQEIFKSELGYIIEGECLYQTASTVLDLTHDEIKIVRQGPIKKEDILKVINDE